MSKWTAGPWKVGSPSGQIYNGKTGRHIATMNINGMDSTPEWWRADARMIAAAPDMLEALKTALRYLEHPDVLAVTSEMAMPGQLVVDRINETIRKAEEVIS